LYDAKGTLLPYRRGGCSPDAEQPKEQQEETGQSPVISSCPAGLRLKISRLRFLIAIILKLLLKSYLCKSEI